MGKGCDCADGFLPLSPAVVTDESLIFCIASLSSQLAVSPTTGANTGGYPIQVDFQNLVGSVGIRSNDFDVVVAGNVRPKFRLLRQGAGSEATARGMYIVMPPLSVTGTVPITVRRFAFLAEPYLPESYLCRSRWLH